MIRIVFIFLSQHVPYIEKIIDFHMLISYPATVLKVCIRSRNSLEVHVIYK
jgi:hypothetical protein